MPTPPDYQSEAPRPEDGPLDLNTLLPGAGPIELDIGFGRGRSLLARARVAPGSRILGIEIKAKWSHRVAQRVQREGLANVVVWCGDARAILSRVVSEATVARVSIHFPDPWWKKRHQKRRVVGSELLDELGRILEPAGQLFVQTDVPERAEQYAQELAAHPMFQLSPGVIDHNPFDAASNREVRAEADGIPIHRLLATRRVE